MARGSRSRDHFARQREQGRYGMRRGWLLAGAGGVAVALVGGVAPAVAVSGQVPGRVAELRFYLSSCTTGPACVAPVALYTRGGVRLTSMVAAALLPSPGDQSEF